MLEHPVNVGVHPNLSPQGKTFLVCGSAWSWFGHAQRPPLDAARLARWDAPPLIAGLTLAALGRRRAGAILVTVAGIVGGAGLLRTTRAASSRVSR